MVEVEAMFLGIFRRIFDYIRLFQLIKIYNDNEKQNVGLRTFFYALSSQVTFRF